MRKKKQRMLVVRKKKKQKMLTIRMKRKPLIVALMLFDSLDIFHVATCGFSLFFFFFLGYALDNLSIKCAYGL